MTAQRILVIDTDDTLAKAVRRALEWADASEEVVALPPGEEALAAVKGERFATILLGAAADALALLGGLTAEALGQPPVFVVADQVSEALTVEVLDGGAVDCIPRSRFMVGGLPKVVGMALEQARSHVAAEQAADGPQLDASTQFGNGSLLIRDLARAIAASERAGRSFCLLLIELERVKSRHSAATEWPAGVTVELAQRLRKTARATDLFFQLAPRRFAALLDAVEAAHCATVARRVRGVVLMPFHLGGNVVDLDARIGMTTYPADGKTPEAILRAADLALKNAMQNFDGIATAADLPRAPAHHGMLSAHRKP